MPPETQEQKEALAASLAPVISRVRTDVSAVKTPEGKMSWTRDPLTDARILKHLNGGPNRGVSPTKAGQSVIMLAVLDLDSHKGATPWAEMCKVALRIIDAAAAIGLKATPWRSSGGLGIHLYFIWDEPQDAYSVRQALAGVLAACDLRDGTKGVSEGAVEIFPKQDSVALDGFGNQFILPLAGASVPLEPMLDLEPLERADALAVEWVSSKPVPVLIKPERVAVALGAEVSVDVARLAAALAAIPNEGEGERDYDQWRNIIFAIHSATEGGDEGLALAHTFSSRAAKYDPDFLDNRVWPYAADREGGITSRTVFAMAREAGWVEDISAEFDVILPEPGAPGAPAVVDMPAFERTEHGAIKATLNNVVMGVGHEPLVGCRLGNDTFRDAIMLSEDGGENWRPFGDADYVTLRMRLEQRSFKAISQAMMHDAVLVTAQLFHFDSAQLWLGRLVWDGVPRVKDFIARYWGAEDCEYSTAVGYYTWSALAGRILEPGVKTDISPVFIGPQGIRKSTGIAAMAPYQAAFVAISLGAEDDKNARLMRGRLVVETGEMKGMYAREMEHIKDFLARQVESWIPKYQEFSKDYPRRCVIFGSSNQDEFLVDETGNRRFAPVRVTKVDTDAIVRDRDQLWAEGAVLFKQNGVIWQETERLAEGKHAEHMIHDEWENTIAVWLDECDFGDADTPGDAPRRGDKPFQMGALAKGALSIPDAQFNKATQKRIANILKGMGYTPRERRVDGRKGYFWGNKNA